MDARDVGDDGFELVMAATHCHAPNCLRQLLRNNETGEVLCDGTPIHGSGDAVYDEAGYLFTPPCLWGHQDDLLPPPLLKKDTKLQMITWYNATYDHPGQMSIYQMKAAVPRGARSGA